MSLLGNLQPPLELKMRNGSQIRLHHYVIKYLMRDMINYHRLRVLRSHVRRIGKHWPGFSVFRTRVHVCSYAEPCRVPIQSTVVTIFLLGN